MTRQQGILFDRNFALLLSGQSLTLLGSTIYYVVLVLYLKQLTGSAAVIGMVEFLAFLPWVLLGPVAGVWVDRNDEKTVLVLGHLLRGVLMILLCVCSLEWLPRWSAGRSGMVDGHYFAFPLPVYVVFLVTLAMGTIEAAFNAAFYALIPKILAKEKLQQGNSFFQGTGGILAMIGNALGGVIFGFAGAAVVFLVNGLAYFSAAVAGLFLSVQPRKRKEQPGSPRSGFVREIQEGFGFIWGHRGLRSQTIIYALSNLLFPCVMLSLPFLIEDVLMKGSIYYGYLLSVLTLSSIAGYLVFGWLKTTEKQNYVAICIVFVVETLAFLALSLSRHLFLVFGLLSVISVGMAVSKLINTSIKQKMIPEGLRGRVFATLDSLNGGLVPLAFAMGGFLIDWTHKNVFLIYAGIFVVHLLLTLWFISSRSIKVFYLGAASMEAESSA